MSRYACELIRFSDGRVTQSYEFEADSVEEAQTIADYHWGKHRHYSTNWAVETPEVGKVNDSNNSGVWFFIRYDCKPDQAYQLTPYNTLYIEEKNRSFRPSWAITLICLDKFERIPGSLDGSVCKWRKRREVH